MKPNTEEMGAFKKRVIALVCDKTEGEHGNACKGCSMIEKMVETQHVMWACDLEKMYKPSFYKPPEILQDSTKMMALAAKMKSGPETMEEFAETFMRRVVPDNNWESQDLLDAMINFAKDYSTPNE